MNLRQLEIFIAVVEEGSLTRAAERVHTVQPALTQHIKLLEEEFGIPLLVRSSRGVRPTDAGRRLVTRAQSIMAQCAALRAHVLGADFAPAGEVRVGMPGTVSALVSPRLISAVAARYPDVRVHIVEPMAGVITDWLEQAKVDFAISYRGAHPRGIDLEKVLTESIDLCGPARGADGKPGLAGAGTIDFAEACSLPLVVQHRGYITREILEGHARQLGCKLNVSIEIDSAGPIKSLVVQGQGYAFLPPMATIAEREQGQLISRRVVAPEVERAIFLASVQDRPLNPTAALVRELCQGLMVDLVRGGIWDARLEATA